MAEPQGVSCGGYLGDGGFCFSRTNEYVLCPCGDRILVIKVATGELIASASNDPPHGPSLVLLVERITQEPYSDFYVSLDSKSSVCLWRLEELGSTSCGISLVKRGYFCLSDLSLHLEPASSSWCILPKEILTLSVSPVSSLDSTCNVDLILTLSCSSSSLENEEKKRLNFLSSEEKDSDVECHSASELILDGHEKVMIHVVQVSLRNVDECFGQATQEMLVCTPLFYFSPRRHTGKGVPKIKSITRCCACEFFIAVVKNDALFVYNRKKKSFFSVTHTNLFSSVTVDPSGRSLVTGDTCGSIVWWRLFEGQENRITDKKSGRVLAQASEGTKALQTRFLTVEYHHEDILELSLKIALEHLHEVKKSYDSTTADELGGVAASLEIPISIQHWHSHPVKTLCFSPSGFHLISAGEEGVLVFWHISQSSRNFMPRFGAPIHFIASASGVSKLIGLSLADNSLRFIDTTSLKVISAYFGMITPLSLLEGGSLQPIALRKRLSDVFPLTVQFFSSKYPTVALVVASGITSEGLGANSRLQVYDVARNRCLGCIRVNDENYVSRTDSHLKKYQWTIQSVCMAPSGHQLATVEYRKSMFPSTSDCMKENKDNIPGCLRVSRGGEVQILKGPSKKMMEPSQDAAVSTLSSFTWTSPPHHHWSGTTHTSGNHYVLKFWSITTSDNDLEISSFAVNTEIDFPHTHDVTQVLCMKSLSLKLYNFLSVSLDGTWKAWYVSLKENGEAGYTLKQTGSYRTLPCLCAALSGDASLLAITHPCCVSIWQTDTFTMQKVLCVPPSLHRVPLRNQCCITFLETSMEGKMGWCQGEALVLCHLRDMIALWDLKALGAPRLMWMKRLPDASCVSMIPNIWGFPMFSLYCHQSLCLEIYGVSRDKSREISCDKKACIHFAQHSSLLFSVNWCSSAFHPQIAVLDSDYRYTLYPLSASCLNLQHTTFCLPQESEHVMKTTGGEEQTSIGWVDVEMTQVVDGRGASKMLSTTQLGRDEEEDMKNKTESTLDATLALSAFLKDYTSNFIKHPMSAKYTECLIGHSPDYASHLIGTPSVLLNRMIQLYNKKL